MNILLINGSPRGSRSNTYRLSSAFVEGIRSRMEISLRERNLKQSDIKPCLGCFSCWNKTPGICCIKDDMQEILQDILWADTIVWSFPLYYFSVPGPVKNLMDRQLPTVLPFMSPDSKSGGHPSRYDMSHKRHVVISTCGFYTAKGNYDSVNAVFDHICGKGKYETVYCGQGELFRVKELSQRTDEYLGFVRDAGAEFSEGAITSATREKLEQLLYPRDVFESMADASWGVEKTGEKTDESLIFTRQMAALYNKASFSGEEIVLEMYYTDIEKRYQILLSGEGSTVLTEKFKPPTTVIETPYTLWKAIAAGEISGQDALMQQKYRVRGDFDLMIHWDLYFGNQAEARSEVVETAKTDMNVLLIPWIGFWIAAAINGYYGPLISILICSIVPFAYRGNKKTVYDQISPILVTLCAIALLMGLSARIVLPLSYLFFGAMWTISCFRSVPLTAHYSMNDYNGEEALKNPLFMKTNLILTACWGVLYLLTPVWTYFLLGTTLASWTGAINSILPMLMGGFTVWFQKWYPARVARGE